MNYLEIHKDCKEESVFGRYVTLEHIEPLILQHKAEIVGKSVLGEPIYKLQFGIGKTKILMWSQMHGNESTTTKALFHLLYFANAQSRRSKIIY